MLTPRLPLKQCHGVEKRSGIVDRRLNSECDLDGLIQVVCFGAGVSCFGGRGRSTELLAHEFETFPNCSVGSFWRHWFPHAKSYRRSVRRRSRGLSADKRWLWLRLIGERVIVQPLGEHYS